MDTTSDPRRPPAWISSVRPGRLDTRVLTQETYWVNRQGVVLRVALMPAGHLQNVARMLHGRAMVLHLSAMIEAITDIVVSAETGHPCGDLLEFSATGASIADVEAHVWLDSLPLMRAIAARLAKTG